VHPVHFHQNCVERLVRDPETGDNQPIQICVIRCPRSRQQGGQYTKRILPEFVIPEANIRLDRVAMCLQQFGTDGKLDYEVACAILGTVSSRTVDRHMSAARQMAQAAVASAVEVLVTLVGFGQLPTPQVSAPDEYRDLCVLVAALNEAARRHHGQRGAPVHAQECLHLIYVERRARRTLAISANQVMRVRVVLDTS
jgi:hypothetical protein